MARARFDPGAKNADQALDNAGAVDGPLGADQVEELCGEQRNRLRTPPAKSSEPPLAAAHTDREFAHHDAINSGRPQARAPYFMREAAIPWVPQNWKYA